MLLNTSKTNEMVVNYTHMPITPVYISRTAIDFVDSIKYLGVTFDCEMSFNHHVDTIVITVTKSYIY